MGTNRINFKQPRYSVPLISLPFLLFLGYQVLQLSGGQETSAKASKEAPLSLSLGESLDPILSKNEAYEVLFKSEGSLSALEGLEKEKESLQVFEDPMAGPPLGLEKGMDSNLGAAQPGASKVPLASSYEAVDLIRLFNERALGRAPGTAQSDTGKSSKSNAQQSNAYQPTTDSRSSSRESMASNSPTTGRSSSSVQPFEGSFPLTHAKTTNTDLSLLESPETEASQKVQDANAMDPVRILREQMLVMDSLEKSRDPEFQAASLANKKLLEHKKKLGAFLSSTLRVSKSGQSPHFNAVYRQSETSFIKAVLDEDLSGFLGSRIRLRLLDDVFVGSRKLLRGQVLYAQVSGFSLERANLSVVSVLSGGEILPIHLSVYDLDGQKGLYVPGSAFRDMVKELGSSSVQGTNVDGAAPSFYSSLLSTAFRSASQSAAKLLRINKAKLKYGTQVLLLQEAI